MGKVNRSLNYKIAMTGVFGALSVVLAITPIGFIQIPGTFISITIMHIPAILAACTAGLVPGIGVGLVFGLTSLIRTAMSGGGANPFFLNPLVSVLPRMLFPVVVWAVYKALDLIPHMPRAVSGAVSAAFGTFCHTLFVMGAIYIFYGQTLLGGMAQTFARFGFALDLTAFKGFIAVMACTLLTNGLWEIAGAAVLTAAVLGPLYAVQNKKSKLTKLEESEASGSDEAVSENVSENACESASENALTQEKSSENE